MAEDGVYLYEKNSIRKGKKERFKRGHPALTAGHDKPLGFRFPWSHNTRWFFFLNRLTACNKRDKKKKVKTIC